MYSVALFLGFPIDHAFAEALKSIDSQLANLFIRKNDDSYLQEVSYNGVRYLGKFAGEINDPASLKLLEENIYSLLKRIVPNYQFERGALVLFPAATQG